LPSKQHRKTSTAVETVVVLPMAEEGQLQWVKRHLSSLSVLASSENAHSATSDVDGTEDTPALWWPSLLFNDYDDFQDFFSDEFNKSNLENKNNNNNDDDASETKGLIFSRMLQNMRQQKTIMVARLLGRSIKEYVEIIELPVEADGAEDGAKSDTHDLVDPHQATEFVSFTRMPQEVHLPQMKPEAFIVVVSSHNTDGDSNTSEEVTTIIDDELYMSYMLALDLAATKRMSGPKAPNDILRSDFRDHGRVELERLPPSVQMFSETYNTSSSSGADVSTIPNASEEAEIPKQQEPNEGGDKTEEDIGDSDSDSDEDTENENKLENYIAQKADVVAILPMKLSETQVEEVTDEGNVTGGIALSSTESVASKESVPSSSAPEASLLQETDAEIATPAAETPDDNTISGQAESKESIDSNGDSVNKGNTGYEKAGVNDPSSLFQSSSATVVSQSTEGPEATDVAGTTSLTTSPTTAPITSPPPKKKLDRPKMKVGTPSTSSVNSPTRKSKRGRHPKKMFDLLEATRKEEDFRTETFATSLTTAPVNCPSPKKKRRPKKKVDLPDTTSKEADTVPEYFATSPSTADSPKPLDTEDERGDVVENTKPASPSALSLTSTPQINRSRSLCEDDINGSPINRLKKLVEEEEFYNFRNLMKDLKNKCGWKYLPAKTRSWHYVLPGRPKEQKGGKNLEDFFFEESEVIQYCKNHNYYERRHELGRVHPETVVDSRDGAQGGDVTVAKTSPPGHSPETRTVTIATTPSSSPQKPIDLDDPGIDLDDSFTEVCNKLECIGWTVDSYDYNYFSPTVGYDDIKMNPQWRGKKFFLGKEDFLIFLRETYGWTGKRTPKKRDRGGSNAVTPSLSSRPKRSRRSQSLCEDDINDSPIAKKDQFKFKSEEEEEFYNFRNLMKDLKNKCGWKYLPAKTRSWHYVLPGRPKEQKGGKNLEDFFFEESEVIQYCKNHNYYERRHELGLEN
jgi:hypothetical protein